MKKIRLLILFSILLFIPCAKANSISSITMDIYIDNNGDAHVTEVWDAKLSSGTEGYKPYYNLGDSEINNYKVSMDGIDFENKKYWNTKSYFDSKAYKYGINKISNGLELCFGISEYGKHKYTMSYTITNFVHELTDSEMVYFTLIPHNLSSKPDKTYIKIHSDFKYSDTLDVWGYGYEGYAYVYDGYIEMSSDGYLSSNEYIVALIKFPQGTFTNLSKIDKDFNYYYELAEEGVVENSTSTLAIIIVIFSFLFQLAVWIFIIVVITRSPKISVTKGQNYKIIVPKEDKKMKNIPNFRDIPCNKDIFRAYFLAYNYGLMKKQTDLLGAVLLKWIKEDRVSINKEEKNGIISKQKSSIIFKDKNEFDEKLESDLYNMLYEASKDGILESKEFEKWSKKHYSKILNWFGKVLDKEAAKLILENNLVKNEKKILFIKYEEYTLNDSLKEEAKQLQGLKKFLMEFTNIKEREAIEVKLYDEYLMFASIFGIANKVAKQFKELYPDYIENYNFDYDDIIFINTFSTSGVNAASSARSRAESYSSGGGGFSSSGGGGGSFGGGGGGGGFR